MFGPYPKKKKIRWKEKRKRKIGIVSPFEDNWGKRFGVICGKQAKYQVASTFPEPVAIHTTRRSQSATFIHVPYQPIVFNFQLLLLLLLLLSAP